MNCDQDVEKILNKLAENEKVYDCEISLKNESVKITHQPQTDSGEFLNALSDLGYKATQITAEEL